MPKAYHYWAKVRTGAGHSFTVEERSGSIADTEAKIEVERWLKGIGASTADLVQFDLVAVRP